MTIQSKHRLKQLFEDTSRLPSSKFYELIDALWKKATTATYQPRAKVVLVDTGTSWIAFTKSFAEGSTIVIVDNTRRASDNAVIDYVISDESHEGFNITVWEDGIKCRYIATIEN